MKKILFIMMLLLAGVPALAQPDRHDVRRGNRSFAKGQWSAADISYRKALMADSTSVAANYNLASVQYRQEDYQGAAQSLQRIQQTAPSTEHGADYYYNVGDVALQAKDYKTAVEAFMQSLLRNPGDLDAKENFIYAKKMLENQQQNQDQNQQDQNQDQQDQNQDQQQQQDQNQNQDQQQNQDQNKDQQDQQQDQQQNQQDQQDQQDQNQEQQPQEARGELSPQQAQQILQAMQDQEKQTQDKVKKEKAAVFKSRQKEKNW
ncbi:MAG: tetratricopeptide repeat protein [Bacteroidales bacterium]|nr:tetratricopeptide repeat protein [Bacteroidales bacterium]